MKSGLLLYRIVITDTQQYRGAHGCSVEEHLIEYLDSKGAYLYAVRYNKKKAPKNLRS